MNFKFNIKNIFTYPEKRRLNHVFFGMKKYNHVYKPFIKDKKFIFIHIPKAAGKSISLAFYGNDKPGHFSVKDYIYYDEEKFNSAFKFTFVRNPIDRFISAYNFLSNGGTSVGDMEFKINVVDHYKDINEFIEKWLSERNILKKEHFIPQSYFLTDDLNRVSVDYIGYFENLDNDFIEISKKCGLNLTLPHVNKGKGLKEDVFITSDNINKLKKLYENDYKILDYK